MSPNCTSGHSDCFTFFSVWCRDRWSKLRPALLIPQNVLKPFIAIGYDRAPATAPSSLREGFLRPHTETQKIELWIIGSDLWYGSWHPMGSDAWVVSMCVRGSHLYRDVWETFRHFSMMCYLSTTISETLLIVICRKSRLAKCGTCRKAYYCNVKCQVGNTPTTREWLQCNDSSGSSIQWPYQPYIEAWLVNWF